MSQEKAQGTHITQEDIDTALQAARRPENISDADDGKPLFLKEDDIVDSGPGGDMKESEYFGLLSREDIEALLHSELDGSSGGQAQDDIDRPLMGTRDVSGEESDGAEGLDSQETGEVLSQTDLDRLLAAESEDFEENVEQDFSKASPVEPKPAPATSGNAGSIEPEVVSEFRDDTETLISQPDSDQLVEGGPKDGDGNSPSYGPKSRSDHISQNDINRLLKESLEEAEDLLDEEADLADENDMQEPVILAADEAPPAPVIPALKPQPDETVRNTAGEDWRKPPIWKNRLAWAAAAGIVFFVSITAMMMSSGPVETASRPKVMTFSLNQVKDAAPEAPVLSDTSIRLSGFLVLAPPNPAAVAYVAADLTLDFSDAAVVAVIKENEAFVRDIIYGTISSELMSRDISTIDEAGLKLVIRKALGQIIAREAIGRISFDRFSLM